MAEPSQPTRARHAPPSRVLFAASEVFPLVKTGGLADAAAALPAALREAGVDVRIIVPGYRSLLQAAAVESPVRPVAADTAAPAWRLLWTTLPGTAVPVYIVDAPALFDRPGTPYQDEKGGDWPDNAQRYALFCRAIVALCRERADPAWEPQLLHCNDWHTGLAPALLAADPHRPPTVFTLHNLAYQGNFPRETFVDLGLPASLWSPQALEFHGMLSFIKGGVVYADRLTTVSPAHAREILTPEFGQGLDGVLLQRRDVLTGILNGADYRTWDPRHDSHIARPYWTHRLGGKRDDKAALQRELGLAVDDKAFLLGYVSRLTWQKGTDLLLEALPELLLEDSLQIALLGSGDGAYEAALLAAAAAHPERVAMVTGYHESLAHRIVAGADAFLMPSRYEPCGLTQLYSMRYGTVPIVRTTGGLADTVVDVTPASLADGSATGFHFLETDAAQLLQAIRRALLLWRQADADWKQLMRAGMKRNFSWTASAARYLDVYASCPPYI